MSERSPTMSTTTNMNEEQKARHEQARTLSEEPHTAAPWWAIVPETDVARGALVVQPPPGLTAKDGDRLTPENTVGIAHFARHADARRTVACVAAFEGMSTQAIETMPEPVVTMLQRLFLLHKLAQSVHTAVMDDDAWAELRATVQAEIASSNAPKH